MVVFSCFTTTVAGQSTESDEEASYKILEEVIVTAQKRGEESLLDTAMSVTAISGDEMARRHAQEMNDYLRNQPGTNFIERGSGRNAVIIRGITSDPGRGGVITGVYIDETPVHGLGWGETGSPDLKLVDIERVEVLRGPQGTLYGAGSMSGTVRTLTRAPELDRFSGYVKVGGSSTSGSGDLNYEVQGVANIPVVEDQFALRAVAYRFDDSGYIRNVAGQDPAKLAAVDLFNARLGGAVDDRGATVTEGFRLGALWRVNDRLDVRLTAISQDTDQDGVPTIDVLQGPFEQSRFARLDGTEESLKTDLELYSLTVNYDAEKWSLTSASAWIDSTASIDWDVGLFFLDALEGVEPPYWLYQADLNDVFTQELRWNWDPGGRWRLLLGAFYEERDLSFVQTLNFEGSPDPFGGFFDNDEIVDSEAVRKSLFADTSVGLTDQLEITAGIRSYRVEGGGFGSLPEDRQSGETLKAGLDWRPERSFLGEGPLIYATWAEGFRPGIVVREPPERCDPDGDGIIDEVGLPWENVDNDDVSSVEIGYKATFAQRRVAVEAAAFKIDWTGLRIDVTVPAPCASTLPFSAGIAESKGFEFALSALLTDDLQLDLSASWLSAELAEDGLLGPAGSRLPGSARYNASLGLEYGFEISGNDAWIRGNAAWVGDYYNNLEETPPRLGDYATLNLGGGVDFGRWLFEVFINNVTDSDALTWANQIWVPYDRETRLRPRTIGARLGYSFGQN
jgi:outer membrane receptor protein involved in Fe transport